MPKTINGHTFATFNDLWEDPEFLTLEEKAEIDLRVEVKGTMIKARESMGYTQSDLANLAHMTQPEIARLEGEMKNPKVSTLIKVLVPLGYRLAIVPVDEHEEAV